MELTSLIYEATAEFPKFELYGLSSQMRRAAVSIPSNLAEGSARRTRRNFRQFVIVARGSNCELQTQILIAIRLGYGSGAKLLRAEELTLDVGRMLNGLSLFLKKQQSAAD